MRNLYTLILLFVFMSTTFSSNYRQYLNFVDPLPDAKFVNEESTIILKPAYTVDKSSLLSSNTILITGSISGTYSYTSLKSTDGETVILKPSENFKPGEKIRIEFTRGIKTSTGKAINPFSYTFTVCKSKVKVNKQYNMLSELSDKELSKLPNAYYNNDLINTFPQPILNHSDNPAPGRILMADFSIFPQYSPNLMILNNDVSIFYSSEMSAMCVDFNMQPNGNLTYYDVPLGKYYELDPYWFIVDSFYCGNGYGTDFHELRILSNRHALLMSYDSQVVDMSQIVPGGDPNCVVAGLIVQEIDNSKNVVFQWRSWDHFQITDAWHENMLAHGIDAVHGNAIELDNDGNLLISSRHLDEITKINRTTGNVIWRFGGKNNQFTFVGDTLKFTYQHAIRRLKNGNVILFDNGNYHSPQFSRAVEYTLDEQNLVATVAWQHRNNPNVFGGAMGFAQRLDNGSTLISWGFTWPTLTEVRMDGSKALEISLPMGVVSYRTFKYIYKENEVKPLFAPASIYLGQNYPNPFNPKTTISFGIPRIDNSRSVVDVLLKVYDVLGREIVILVDEPLKPYTYSVEFDASNLASGVYFYALYASGGNAKYYETKKMLLVK